jgi:mycoredoxin
MSDLYTTTPSQIIAYTVSWCGDCKRAKRFFAEKNIPYVEIDVDNDPQAEEFVKRLNNGSRSVPTIIFPDGTKLVEPSTEQLNAKFN